MKGCTVLSSAFVTSVEIITLFSHFRVVHYSGDSSMLNHSSVSLLGHDVLFFKCSLKFCLCAYCLRFDINQCSASYI